MALLDAYPTVYRIHSAIDPDVLVIDVAGASTATGAAVDVWTPNDGKNQIFSFEVANTNYENITCRKSKLALTAKGYASQAANGTRVVQHTSGAGKAVDDWYLVQNGTVEYNGETVDTYGIIAYRNSTLSDGAYLLTVPDDDRGTRLELWHPIYEDDGETLDASQRWMVREWTELSTNYPAPSSGAWRTTATGSDAAEPLQVAANGVQSLYPSFAWTKKPASTPNCWVRYRTRTRLASAEDDTMGDWSTWQMVGQTDAANMGWPTDQSGAELTAVTNRSKRLVANSPISLNLANTYDRMDVEFNAVVCYPSSLRSDGYMGTHSAIYSWMRTMVSTFAISSVAVAWVPDGLQVTWVSTSTRELTATVSGSAIDGKLAYAGCDASDSVTIPADKLSKRVGVGDSITLRLELENSDGAKVVKTSTVSVTSDAVLSITMTASVSGTLATVTPSDNTAKLYLVIPRGHGDRYALVGRTFAPPLNAAWSVWAISDTGYGLQAFPAISDRCYHITSQDLTHDCVIEVNLGDTPRISMSYSSALNEYETYGRERPVYGFGAAVKNGIELSGVIVPGRYGDLDDVDWLAHAHHVLYRDPHGRWCQCAVSSVKLDYSSQGMHGYVPVTISLMEEVW